MRRRRALLFVAMWALLCASARGETLTLVDGKEVAGTVKNVTSRGVTLGTASGERVYKYDELEAECAYDHYRRTVDQGTGEGRLVLGRFCAKRRLFSRARLHLLTAKRLDPKLGAEVDRVWAESGAETRPDATPAETDRVIAEQRSRKARVSEAAGQSVTTLETEHFIIHTTFPEGDHKLLKSLCERLYAGFDKVFEISEKDDRMWDGKCVMYLFKDREGFVKFAQQVHRYPAQASGGYFMSRGRQCEVVIPNLGGLDRFKETMVHEGAHAFLHFYGREGRVPVWVQEGVAQYFQFSEFPESSMLRSTRRTIGRAVKAGPVLDLKTLAASNRPATGADHEAYAFSYAYVSYLIHAKPKQFAKFIAEVKSGEDAETALRTAFEWDYAAVQEHCLKAVARGL